MSFVILAADKRLAWATAFCTTHNASLVILFKTQEITSSANMNASM